jgi:hypothetical protein
MWQCYDKIKQGKIRTKLNFETAVNYGCHRNYNHFIHHWYFWDCDLLSCDIINLIDSCSYSWGKLLSFTWAPFLTGLSLLTRILGCDWPNLLLSSAQCLHCSHATASHSNPTQFYPENGCLQNLDNRPQDYMMSQHSRLNSHCRANLKSHRHFCTAMKIYIEG